MTTRRAVWFVRRATDRRILCRDGKWRLNAGYIESIKFYSSDGRAARYGLKGCDGTAYAVYPGDSVDCCGGIVRGNLREFV